MPAEMLTKQGRETSPPVWTVTAPDDQQYEWARKHVQAVRRLKLHVAAFVLGMLVLTPLWALIEWQDNGGFERWSDNSQPGDWEPWILYVALAWGLVLAVKALHVHFDRPTTEAEVDRELGRLDAGGVERERLREWARRHVERVRKLKRDAAAFGVGMVGLTAVWALVEWQANGGFERFSGGGNPGDWEPWVLYIALIWGFFVALDVLKAYFDRPTTQTEIDREIGRLG